MKPMRAAVLATVMGAALAQAAAAADLGGGPRRGGIKDGPIGYSQPFSWTGFYFGAHVGYGWSDIDWTSAFPPGFGSSQDGSGWLAGGQIGYNIQRGQLVFGVEADISGLDLDANAFCPNPGVSCSHSYNWLASARGRLGAAVNANRTLLYVTAGGAWADIDYTALGFGTFSDTHFGWVGGAGIEHALTPNLTARFEYLHYWFDDRTAPAGALGAGAVALEPTTQAVRFGLNFKF